jgi:hypothetical protein
MEAKDMSTILDAIGVPAKHVESGTKKQTSKTWLAGKSTGVNEHPLDQYHAALGRLFGATKELESNDNSNYGRIVKPGLEQVIIGLDQKAFFLATAEMLTPEAKKKLGIAQERK